MCLPFRSLKSWCDMRQVPATLAAELATGATTLCRCWKAVRRDGMVFGFTDHDRDLSFAGVSFRAETGLDASEAERTLGLAVGGGEVAGVLSAAGISEADIAAGRWDGASIETWIVDWRDVSRRMLMDAGETGEIRREGQAFAAEVRGLAHQLDQEQGRRYISRCDAELGDSRCGVSLAASVNRVTAVIAGVPEALSFTVPSPAGFAAGAFTGGTVRFDLGVNAGATLPVMAHVRAGGTDVIRLWAAPPASLAAGDQLTLTVGCDKRFETCRDRFANGLNYRGFPHIPGNDFILSYARQGEAGQDGGAIAP
jgi:uncharacterized phage protein (TIGR02218 family)